MISLSFAFASLLKLTLIPPFECVVSNLSWAQLANDSTLGIVVTNPWGENTSEPLVDPLD